MENSQSKKLGIHFTDKDVYNASYQKGNEIREILIKSLHIFKNCYPSMYHNGQPINCNITYAISFKYPNVPNKKRIDSYANINQQVQILSDQIIINMNNNNAFYMYSTDDEFKDGIIRFNIHTNANNRLIKYIQRLF